MNQHVKPSALKVVPIASPIPAGVSNLETILDDAEALLSGLALALDSAEQDRIAIDPAKQWRALQHLADEARFKLKEARAEWDSAWKELGGVG